MKYSFKMTAKDIDKAIGLLAKRGKALENDIHRVAVSCLVQIADHGNTTSLRRLYATLKGSSVRAEAIKAWACHFGGVTFDNEAEDKATGETGTFTRVKGKAVDLEGSEATTPFAFKKEPEFKPFNLDEMIGRIVGQARKRVEKGDERDTIDMSHLQTLEQMIGKGPGPSESDTDADGKPTEKERAETKKTLKQNA